MTNDQWIALAQPFIIALLPTIGLIGAAMISGLTDKIRTWLDAHGHSQASRIVADASTRMQAAMQNEAGQIALEVEQGTLDLKDVFALHKRLVSGSEQIAKKLPDAVTTLNPLPGSIYDGIRGKITAALPVPDPQSKAAPSAQAAPAPTVVVQVDGAASGGMPRGDTQARAAWLIRHLKADLALAEFQAVGFVANLQYESGLKAINEIAPSSGRGGWAWPQWTGSRRLAFENWCTAKGLSVSDDAAIYAYILVELNGPERAALEALRATTTLEEATLCVEQKYERAGVAAVDRRQAIAHSLMLSRAAA